MRNLRVGVLGLALVLSSAPLYAQDHGTPPKVDERARLVPHDSTSFGDDPSYPELKYDYQSQLDIYGAKFMNKTQRPLLELGREMYGSGPFRRAPKVLGSHNVMMPQLLVYGDVRLASGFNRFGSGNQFGTAAGRLNLDVDLKLTATERVHALFRPFEKDGVLTRAIFASGTASTTTDTTITEFSGEPVALFFEGDLGAILGGLTGRDAPFDMPIAAGLMPLLFHNGTWLEDAFTGAGATIMTARNSRSMDISNFDVQVFAGFDKVSNQLSNNGRIYGINTAIERHNGLLEIGYAYVDPNDATGLRPEVMHSVGVSYTKRYGGRISNSLRYIGAFGTRDATGLLQSPADGHLFLIENSLITSKPSTRIPYLNLFIGLDNPNSAARDPGAGGVLKNTGLGFEEDAITGFPALNATAEDAVGGALGFNILGDKLNSQVVLEGAVAYPHKKSLSMPGEQFAFSLRAQKPISNSMIIRADGVYGKRSGLTDITGVRVELRRKF